MPPFDPRRTDNWLSRSLAAALVVVVAAFLVWMMIGSSDNYRPYVAAGVLGALVAIAELVTRYRDDPPSAILSLPGEIYILVNIASSVSALYLIHVFDWRFGATQDTLQVTQVLVAGFGSAALFRSSLLNVTVGNQLVGIGPSAVLNVILSAADRAVDRQRAWVRARLAASIMAGLEFSSSADSMLAFTGAAMQNLTDVEAQSIESKISLLRDKNVDGVPDQVKSYILGLSLLSLTGRRTLEAIAHEVREVQQASPAVSPGSAEGAAPVGPDEAVLDYLRSKRQAVQIQVLQRDLGLNYRDVTDVLSRLELAGAIRLTGDAAAPEVSLVT